eukprot:13112-Heterococcus_DN1.PRE.4
MLGLAASQLCDNIDCFPCHYVCRTSTGAWSVAVPTVLEAPPQILLQAQRRVDLGLLNLDTVTEATFTVNNTCDQLQVRHYTMHMSTEAIAMHKLRATGFARLLADPVKYVVMLLTKPSANVLTVSNNSTGSLAPRGSQEVIKIAVTQRHRDFVHAVCTSRYHNICASTTVAITFRLRSPSG